MRMPISVTLAVLLRLALASALEAGTVYIAPVLQGTVGGFAYETEVVVSNPTTQPLSFTVFAIHTGADGTARSPASNPLPRITVAPGATVVLDRLADGSGIKMLEVTSDDDLVFSARLDPRPTFFGRLGARLPVVSSHDVIAGGTTYHIQGWERTAASHTAFGAINLSHEANRCRFELVGSNGVRVAAPIELHLAPLSSLFIRDALTAVGVGATVDTRLAVRCDGPSYAYGLARSGVTGDLKLLEPSRTGASSLQPPLADDCPSGSACFSLPSFQPSPGNEIVVYDLVGTNSRNSYDRVRVEMSFEHGGWDVVADGLHGLFWLYRNDLWRANTFGYVNLRGPNRNLLAHLANVGLPPPADPVRSTTGVALQPGSTYRLEFVYDGPARQMRTRLSDSSGALIAELVDQAPSNRVPVQGGFKVQLGLHRELVEVPTYGWVYRDVRVVFE